MPNDTRTSKEKRRVDWRDKLHEIIFEADTPAGKFFDVTLIFLILVSVAVVTAESVPHLNARYGTWFRTIELVLTMAFTVEYVLRIICLHQPRKYIFSFFGMVDILSILPTYIGLIFVNSHYLAVIRVLRLLRIFRVFKLSRFIRESNTLVIALRHSQRKIMVFLFFVLLLNMILGTIIYAIENGTNPGFSSIPQSIYWAIVTLSTVGYGDVAPVTTLGKMVASVIMIIGYSIIAVPTGIVSVEMNKVGRGGGQVSTRSCRTCSAEGHAVDADFCKKCGSKL